MIKTEWNVGWDEFDEIQSSTGCAIGQLVDYRGVTSRSEAFWATSQPEQNRASRLEAQPKSNQSIGRFLAVFFKTFLTSLPLFHSLTLRPSYQRPFYELFYASHQVLS